MTSIFFPLCLLLALIPAAVSAAETQSKLPSGEKDPWVLPSAEEPVLPSLSLPLILSISLFWEPC